MLLVYRLRVERPLASLGKSQNLVALELGEAFNNGLSQCPHGCPLVLQCVYDLEGVLLLPPHRAAPSWGTVTPIWGHTILGTESASVVAPLRTGMTEKVLLELVTPHGVATDTTRGHLAPPLLPWPPFDPAWGRGLERL